MFSRLCVGTMCTYYLSRSLHECLAAVNAKDYEKVCDLERGWRTMILLGSALTSFAMLGFKMAHIQVVRLQFTEQQRMEREREELIAELEQTVSADVAGKVGGILRRRSSVGAALLPSGIHPGLLKGLEGLADESTADGEEGSDDGAETDKASDKGKASKGPRKSITWKLGGGPPTKGKKDKDKQADASEVEFLGVRPEPSQAQRASADLDSAARSMLSQQDADYITYLEDESEDPRISPPPSHFTRQPVSVWGGGYEQGERITRGSFTGTVVEY